MKQALIVGLGGFVGSVLRFKVGAVILHHSAAWRFPLSTFCINVIGCFIIGALAGFAERQAMSAELRLLLFTGLLGGFTTFSAFGLEGVNLIRRGEVGIAVSYALLSVICGFAAVFLALRLFGTAGQRL
ncbi:MAG: fluoride efflux transporter CrcB [Chthoniobacterales bacterium]